MEGFRSSNSFNKHLFLPVLRGNFIILWDAVCLKLNNKLSIQQKRCFFQQTSSVSVLGKMEVSWLKTRMNSILTSTLLAYLSTLRVEISQNITAQLLTWGSVLKKNVYLPSRKLSRWVATKAQIKVIALSTVVTCSNDKAVATITFVSNKLNQLHKRH